MNKNTAFYLSWGSKETREDGRHCEEDWEKEVPEIFDFLWTGL